MNTTKCLKCGHVAEHPHAAPEACPACGAVYRKVAQALSAGPVMRAAPASVYPTGKSHRRGTTTVFEYAEAMREESLYPTWRELVKWATWLWYLVAAALVVSGAIALKSGNVMTGIGTLSGAVVVVIAARVWRELSLMIADLADAAVRQAANTSSGHQP